MKYFYTIKGFASYSGSTVSPTTTGNPVFIPCKIGSYTMDGHTQFKPSSIAFYLTAKSGTTNAVAGVYSYGGQSYAILRSQTTLGIANLLGPTRMCVSDVEITGGAVNALGYYLNSMPTTTISGQFRLHQTIGTAADYNLIASVCPVMYSINNTNYRYLVFPGGGGYTDLIIAGNEYRYSIAGFNTVPVYGNIPSDYELFTESATSAVVKSEYAGQIIDFGDTPQIIPQAVYNFITANADAIYPYTYVVKNKQGVTLDQIDECPAIQSVAVSRTGETVDVVLLGVNNQSYTMQFSIQVPEHYVFLGMAYSAASKRADLPTGYTTAVTWNSNMTIYPIIAKSYPPAVTFSILTYHNKSDSAVVTKDIVSISTINGALREGSSIMDPVITIEQTDIPTFNYVKIPAFNNRYYYVTDITSVAYGLWRITLHTDVLMTYDAGIRSLTAIIDRQENDFNAMLSDDRIPLDNDTEQTFVELSNAGPFSQSLDASSSKNIIVTIVRGDNT